MHFKNFFLALATATAVSALTLPANAKDGTYYVQLIDGVEVHTKVSERTAEEIQARNAATLAGSGFTPVTEGSPLTKRDVGRIWCGCGFNMVDWECDRAVQGLKDQFGSGQFVYNYLSWYTIRGPVVAFFCSEAEKTFVASSDLTEAYAHITRACGYYIAGTTAYVGMVGKGIIGYMRYGPGVGFCQAATTSPVNRC